MGAVCAAIWGGRSGSSDVMLFYLRILSPCAENRSAIFPQKTGIDLVARELCRFANADNAERLRRKDLQYGAGRGAVISDRNFDGVLPAAGSRSGTGVSELGVEFALQQRVQRGKGVLPGRLAEDFSPQIGNTGPSAPESAMGIPQRQLRISFTTCLEAPLGEFLPVNSTKLAYSSVELSRFDITNRTVLN